MYFQVAIISMLCWVIHTNLFVKYARNLDGISISFYRSLSILVTMLPILLLADFGSLDSVFDNLGLYFVGGLLGGVAAIFLFESQKYLPIGIISALDKLIVIVVLVLSYFIYGELISLYSLFGIFLILTSIIALILVKNNMPHLGNNAHKGFILMIPRIIGTGIWYFILGLLSKKVDFALSAYLMEAFVFVGIVISIFFKYLFNKTHIIKINLKDYLKIFLFSIFTLGGTGGYALAVSMGGAQGVIASILAAETIFISILGYFLYKEKLNIKQWVFILCTFIGLVLLKLST